MSLYYTLFVESLSLTHYRVKTRRAWSDKQILIDTQQNDIHTMSCYSLVTYGVPVGDSSGVVAPSTRSSVIHASRSSSVPGSMISFRFDFLVSIRNAHG